MNNSVPQENVPEFEFGIYTLGDIVTDCHTGQTISPRQRLHEVIAAAKLADEAGLDVFGVGEHHRLDFVILGAGCTRGNFAGHETDQADKRHNGAEHYRSGAGLRRLRHT